MAVDLSHLVANVTAYEEQRKHLEDEVLTHRSTVIETAITEVGQCDVILQKLGLPVPPSPFAEVGKPRKATKTKAPTARATDTSRRGITKEAMWKELRRFFSENGPLTRSELWDLAEDYCDRAGINLGVRMVFDRTITDPKFAQEFHDVFKRVEDNVRTTGVPHPSEVGAIAKEPMR